MQEWRNPAVGLRSQVVVDGTDCQRHQPSTEMFCVLSAKRRIAIGYCCWIPNWLREVTAPANPGRILQLPVFELLHHTNSSVPLRHRSEGRRDGNECVITCRSRWWP